MWIPVEELAACPTPRPLRQATTLVNASAPRVPQFHLFEAEGVEYALLADGSRIYRLPATTRAALEDAVASGSEAALEAALARHQLAALGWVMGETLPAPNVRAVSLAVAQKCNLSCSYCYAQQGEFGGEPRNMPLETALAAVDMLLAGAAPGERITLAFLGGEPLVNRPVLRAATEYAARRAAEREVPINFSITTNGTLLSEEDGRFFERHGFAVTVSLDGVGEVHDRQRPFKNGRGSYARIIGKVTPLLAAQQQMQISARVTVTPQNLDLRETMEGLIQLGFHSVGFSPLLSSPAGTGEMGRRDLLLMLEQMVACGQEFERQVAAGRRYPFTNLVTALRELHRGAHRPLPCGAGAGYMGVSAQGGLFACHRFVDDDTGAMGSLAGGVDRQRQEQWLADRHVNRQEPCRRCWARYLCGGSCHHEALRRGRPACDYIRGWLHYCLQAYVRLLQQQPAYFDRA